MPDRYKIGNKAYRRRHFELNKQTYYDQKRSRLRGLRSWFYDFKRTLSCVICGEAFPDCLDFHHKDPTEKDASLSKMVTLGWSKARTMEEVAKCVVLCSNCHRKLHAGLFDLLVGQS